MKNIIILLAFALTVLSSCEKEVAPVSNTNATATPPPTREITVDYAIYSASSNFELVYLINDNGNMVEKTQTINRMNHTIHFINKSQQLLSVKARNINPSHDEVMVTIYVDGNLFKSNSTTGLNSWAVASGSPF